MAIKNLRYDDIRKQNVTRESLYHVIWQINSCEMDKLTCQYIRLCHIIGDKTWKLRNSGLRVEVYEVRIKYILVIYNSFNAPEKV